MGRGDCGWMYTGVGRDSRIWYRSSTIHILPRSCVAFTTSPHRLAREIPHTFPLSPPPPLHGPSRPHRTSPAAAHGASWRPWMWPMRRGVSSTRRRQMPFSCIQASLPPRMHIATPATRTLAGGRRSSAQAKPWTRTASSSSAATIWVAAMAPPARPH